MASVNKVILVGNVGKDPETRYTPNGDQITNASLATTDSWKDKATGEHRESTEWHRLVFFGKIAEIASQYVKKGSQIYVEGRLKTRKWQGQDGQDRYTTEINVDSIQLLGRREREDGSGGGQNDRPPRSAGSSQGNARPSQGHPSAGSAAPRSAPPGGGVLGGFEDDIPY